MLAIEANDEWLVGRAYMAKHTMEPLLEQRLHRASTAHQQEVRELAPA